MMYISRVQSHKNLHQTRADARYDASFSSSDVNKFVAITVFIEQSVARRFERFGTGALESSPLRLFDFGCVLVDGFGDGCGCGEGCGDG